ncbi:MAG: sialidase family protein [Bacteroidota bacterium]
MKISLLSLFIIMVIFKAFGQDDSSQIAEGVTEFHDLFNASKNENVSCYRIPSIVTALNGDLVVAIDERVPSCGDLKWSKDINIVVRRSIDNGKNWSSIERVIDFPFGQSASDPSMIVDDKTGVIFLLYNFMDLNKEKDIYYLHYVKSIDNGKTWSKPVDITSQITKPEWHNDFMFITSGRGIYTSNGKMLHCLVNLDHGMHVFGSSDHGENWYLIDSPVKPANESKIVELADGNWMINSRTNKKGMRYVHVSTDEGKTWQTRPEPVLVDPGCNGSIIRYTSVADGYEKNRLLFSNVSNQKRRQNLTVRISYDEGKTWTEGKTIYPGGSAYSSLTILENGEIGLVFEKDGYTENPFVSFSLEWLTDGKDNYKKPKFQ